MEIPRGERVEKLTHFFVFVFFFLNYLLIVLYNKNLYGCLFILVDCVSKVKVNSNKNKIKVEKLKLKSSGEF